MRLRYFIWKDVNKAYIILACECVSFIRLCVWEALPINGIQLSVSIAELSNMCQIECCVWCTCILSILLWCYRSQKDNKIKVDAKPNNQYFYLDLILIIVLFLKFSKIPLVLSVSLALNKIHRIKRIKWSQSVCLHSVWCRIVFYCVFNALERKKSFLW